MLYVGITPSMMPLNHLHIRLMVRSLTSLTVLDLSKDLSLKMLPHLVALLLTWNSEKLKPYQVPHFMPHKWVVFLVWHMVQFLLMDYQHLLIQVIWLTRASHSISMKIQKQATWLSLVMIWMLWMELNFNSTTLLKKNTIHYL